MGFRETLKDELSYQGILVKELSQRSGIPKGTIDHYLAEKCTAPTVENAVKIAQALGVTVEYLVTGCDNHSYIENNKSIAKIDLSLCKKYYSTIKELNNIPENTRKSICQMIKDISTK